MHLLNLRSFDTSFVALSLQTMLHHIDLNENRIICKPINKSLTFFLALYLSLCAFKLRVFTLQRSYLKIYTYRKDDWRITAVIDFGDVSVSSYLFELAITMSYAMLVSGDLKTGGFVLGGYSLARIVPEKEIKLLKVHLYFHTLSIAFNWTIFFIDLCSCKIVPKLSIWCI